MTPDGPEPRPSRLIGEVIVDLGFADQQTVEAAVESARAQGMATGQVLLDQGTLTEGQLAQVVAQRFGIDFVDVSHYEVDLVAFNLLDPALAKNYDAVPISFDPDGTLVVAMAEPNNLMATDGISMIVRLKIRPVAASREDIRTLIERLGPPDSPLESRSTEDAAP